MGDNQEDVRISDIAETVHSIAKGMGSLEDRISKAEDSVTNLDHRVVEATANHRALEKVMGAELRRVGDKVWDCPIP